MVTSCPTLCNPAARWLTAVAIPFGVSTPGHAGVTKPTRRGRTSTPLVIEGLSAAQFGPCAGFQASRGKTDQFRIQVQQRAKSNQRFAQRFSPQDTERNGQRLSSEHGLREQVGGLSFAGDHYLPKASPGGGLSCGPLRPPQKRCQPVLQRHLCRHAQHGACAVRIAQRFPDIAHPWVAKLHHRHPSMQPRQCVDQRK